MSEIRIPAAALEAGARKLCAKAGYAWTETPDVHSHWREQARAAFLAMIEVWEGMKSEHLSNWVMEGADLPYVEETPAIILPLPPQEASDAKR